MATDGEVFGHKQMTVLEQIQSILEKYPFGDQILKEVIQNADDAGAEQVDFMLDLDSHSQDGSGLVDPSLAKYQGPALYSWNSASFSERDWKGIEETGRSSKKEDYLKVGRFGLGFISMYHITDCPWIISKQNICYLDPQNENPDKSGRRYPLSSFFTNPKYSGHHSCFSRHYFGFNGGSEFSGTIFRFPLRTGSYSSSISSEVHGVDEIRSVLFDPLIREGEHIIPFLKYVNQIRILEKVNNKVSVVHYVAVADRFKQSLYAHRKEITVFAESKCYHEKTGLFITLYPIDTNGSEAIWMVMNLLGFGERSAGSSDNEFYRFYCKNTLKYIPWFGIAMPTGAKSCPSIENNHTWKFDWNGCNFDSILEFIQSNVRFSLPLSSDSILDTNDGKYYCFLPIPKESLFPFHIHAYFALDDNRKSPKWPSSYDRSPDSKWNMFQSEMLGTVLYASFLHLSILNFSHPQPENYHYKLFGDFNIHEMDDSLFSIIQREGLRLLLNRKLVFSQSLHWIPLDKALYAPSTIPELTESVWSSDTERCCINLLLRLSEPIVELPSNVIALIAKYQFLKESIKPQILSPKRMRNILRLNSSLCLEFLATKQNAIQLLDVVLWDLEPSSDDVHLEEALEGIPLLLTADKSSKPRTFSAETNEIFYISEITSNYLSILPGLESRFVDPALPQNIHEKLVNISRVIAINIRDITHIEPKTFSCLLTQFFNTTFHSVTLPLTWTPGCNNQPRPNWIKCLWEFIGTSTTLLTAVEQFPILPKGLLSTQSIQLLPAQSNEVPYVEFDATRGATEIENILSEAGCELCHRHFFIQRFEDFVLRPVPQCLVSVFRNEHILTHFISLISKTSNGTHRQLIEFFNSIPLDSKEARDIVKRVPIFLNFKGHWLTLSTQIGQRFPVLAPKTIPDNIDYPPHILTPFDSPLVVLYQKLNISNNNENEFIKLDLVPYMISSELFQSPLTRNHLAIWVLDRLPALQLAPGDELLEFLRDTKWLVDSSTPSDKLGEVKLFKPSGMLNPIDPLLKQLIDRSNEGFFPNGIYDDHVEKMKKYFEFKSNDNLNSRLRKEVSKAAINNLREKKCYGDWLTMFRALLQLISLYFEKCELRDQESLWKEFNKKFVLPQLDIPSLMPFKLTFDGTLCFPSQVIACTLEQVPLIALVKRFIVIPELSSPETGDTYTGILTCMGFETQIPCTYVVEQLNYIINSFHNEKCDSLNFHEVLSTIYQNLNLHTTSPSMKNMKSRFIFSEERREFIEIANMTETTDFDMRPYLYSYGNLGYNCLQLFRSLGMSMCPTADQYSSVLNTIYIQSNGNPISPQQLGIVFKILEVSNLDPNVYTIYVPGHDNVMYQTSDDRLVFSDEKWLNRAQICSEFPFVFAHERISRGTAINLGITSFYERVATGALYRTLDQKQSVIQEIKCLLESYSDELALVREMVQNSDDSGASQMKILFDYRCHPSLNNPDTSSLLSRAMHRWQGPAIWFYNDQVMQESDCHNILCVGGRGKANDVTKIGRDGVGFCSAFYLTDLPSFVSGDTLDILDPHMEYTEQKYFKSNVCKIDFCSKKFVKFYRDQLAPYQDLFGCNILNNESYKSTLFRIPLRSDGIKSQLSVKSYDKNKMEYIQKLIIKYVENILLFTENLTRIEISELRENTFTNAGAHIKPIYWIKREPGNFQSLLKTQKTTLEQCLQGESIDSIEHSFECSIISSTMHSPKHWLLCYTSGGGDELADFVNSMENENYRIHAPITAVAFDLDRLTERSLVFETNLFCLHPLSVSLQLPYHCNGMFELDSGKMALCNEAMEPQKTEWNTFLISNALTNAVLNLYTCLAEKAQPDLYCHFLYNIFSKKMISHPVWKTFCVQITQKLMQSKARLFPVTSAQGDSWSSFSEVVVLNELELKDKIVDVYFNQSFLDSIKQFLFNLKGLKIATVPAELHQSSGLLDFLLTHTNSDSIIGINRIVELFFESLHEMSEDLMMGLLPALIASHSSIPILFNLISNVPCIPCGDSYQLRVPSDVIDPNNSILSDLYYPEENKLPSSRAPLFTTDSPCYLILKKEFGLLSKQLTLSCLQERVDKIVADGDTQLSGKILVYLNQDIFSNFDTEQLYAQISNHRFIPTLQGYQLSIQSEYCLAAPKQVVVYSLRHFLSLQRTVLTNDVSCLSHAIKLLKIQPNCTADIPTDMLLNEIVVCRETYEELSLHSELLLEKMACLFGELAERMEKDIPFIIANLDKKCIYIPDVGFVNPERVIFEHERSLSPYIHSIKHLYRLDAKSRNFFLSIGVGQTLTLIQCLDVLEELSEADVELNSTDEALAITLIDEMANRLYKEIGKSSSTIAIFLIGEDKYIHKSSESIFFDLKWKDKGGYKGDIKINNKSYYFVHSQISNSTADKLGAISLSSSIITIASRKLKFGYQIKSQQERLTNRLKDIVDRYEAPVEVFKELLQNADDAKAKTVKFLFDMSSYGNTSLIRSEMEVCQGPSLYVYNDKTFSTNDFKNIMDIGGETKKTDTTKIGRFGLGFNTVYHLTDIPSFVSGRFIHILDPHLFCGESGLEINFTENEAILKECYFDQFEVYNDIFDCNVFSEIPYDGTLFRFPFRTPRTASAIKPTGLFHKKGDIKKLQQSFLDIIEQVIFFLQYVQTIEVYERREKGGKKQLICKVDKTFKTRPYQTSFLNNYEDHFNSIVKCEREHHVSAIEVIEICRDKSSCEEYILSYASGTGECVDVINKFEELKQASVLPVAAVGIPRQLLSPEDSKAKRKCEEDYKLFCFLPIPKKSPYRMHINGYFHLSSYRTELHITEENAHLTQWNCSLVNDALPNALISLLMHIREELFPQSTSSAQLEKYYSYFPLSDTKEKPWDTYASKTIQKIIDSDLPLFPCALHPENWISFSEVSFLTCTNLNVEFIMFLKKLASEMDIFFVDIPNSIKHTRFFTNLFKKSKKSYDFKRVCEELLFPNIEVIMDSSLKDLEFVISNLLDLYSNQKESYLGMLQKSPLCNLAFIPCGDSDPVLRIPSEVVHPDSKFSSIYYPGERRLPHTEFHKLFNTERYVLERLGVILDGLCEKELIERCRLAQSIYSDDRDKVHEHSMVLLNYINTCHTIPDSLSSIDFLPVWEDPLFIHLDCRDTGYLIPPEECYSYSCRYLITPRYYALSEDVSKLGRALELLNIQSSVRDTNIIVDLLEIFYSKEDSLREYEDDSLDERMKQIYCWLAWSCFPEEDSDESEARKKKQSRIVRNEREQLKEYLKNKAWIWHPAYKQFYEISQVKIASEFLTFKSKFLITFPYPDLLASKYNKVRQFFGFMGLKPNVEYSEAIEILSKMRQEYDGNILEECDFELAKRLILEEVGKYYDQNRDNTPPEETSLLSENNCLHLAKDLFRNDIDWMEDTFSDTDKEFIVNKYIPAFMAHILGAKSKRSTYFEEESIEGIQMEKFGPSEAISDRIENIKSQVSCDVTILNELLQNAEDAGATEIAFILDKQKYPTDHLCFASDTHREWQRLQSTPSLLVYNNQAFTENDLIGIQKVGIGGKRSRQTIGRFGIGFNAVYHLTRSPCLLTYPGGDTTTFCIFDPYREYLNISDKYELPGKKIKMRNDCKQVFKDQLRPYEVLAITENDKFPDMLTNLKFGGCYSLFRFPLTATKNGINKKINGILDQLLIHSSRLLLFLKNIKRIDIMCIDEKGEVQPKGMLVSNAILHPDISPDLPEFYSDQYLKSVVVTVKEIKTETWTAVSVKSQATNEVRIPETSNPPSTPFKSKKESTKWLCYNHEESVEYFPDHEKFRDKIESEKLNQIFGNIAVNLTNISKKQKVWSYIFCFLPIGTSFNFPIHINAPLIVDPHRRFLKFSEKGQEGGEEQWEYTWHKSVIHHVLVPLYAKLLLDLRDLHVISTGIDSEAEYYKWYYSVFPNISISKGNNAPFLELISRELYALLHETNQPVLISNGLDKLYSFNGLDQGVFKVKTSKELGDLYSALNNIQYPLTNAPDRILEQVEFLKLEYQTLDPNHLVNFLIDNKELLSFGEDIFPCELKDSVLSFREVLILLGFILKTSSDQLNALTEIPLKVDSQEILCSFSKATEDDSLTFLSDYASLLPHCASNFIHLDFTKELNNLLTQLGFIRDLSPEFLANNILIDEAFTKPCYLLFWRFAIKVCKSIDKVVQLFGAHALVPVYHRGENPDDKSLCNYPISQLDYIVSEDLVGREATLCTALRKLDCPFLDLKDFKEEVLSFMKNQVISDSNQVSLTQLIGCLSHGAFLAAELGAEEALLLRKSMSGMQDPQIKLSAKVLFKLRIFLTNNKTLKSISEFTVCFVNESNFKIEQSLTQELEAQGIGIFSAKTKDENPINLIKCVACEMKIQIINTEKFVSEYILPCFPDLPVEEQMSYLIAISKLEGIVEENIYTLLSSIPFIKKHNSDEIVTTEQLYLRTVPLFILCLKDELLPEAWNNETLINILTKLGLKTCVTLPILKECACIIADNNYDDDEINKFLSILVNFLKMRLLTQSDIALLGTISEIKCVPIKKISKIDGQELTYDREMGSLQAALPHSNLGVCGTMCFILPELVSDIPQGYWPFLNIQTNPPCSVVIEHLRSISEQCQEQPPEDNVIHERLFHETYTYLQNQPDFNSQELEFDCITSNGIIFSKMNLVFELENEIFPYLFKVPSSLSNFRNFLTIIGVEQTATYTHYVSVLRCIYLESTPTDHRLDNERMSECAKIAFSTLVTMLRSLPSDADIDLDPSDTHVLTDDNMIMPCDIVYYAENTSLLAKVKRNTRIEINILKTLPPDENGSGVPPTHLKIQNMKQVLIPSLSTSITSYIVTNHQLTTIYSQIFVSQHFHRSLMRLYYHETHKNIIHLKLRDGQIFYSEDQNDFPADEGYKPVLDLVRELAVISVSQIDLDITDNRTNEVFTISNALSCYKDLNTNEFYINSSSDKRSTLPTFVAKELNSFLAKIFSKTLNALEFCFKIALDTVMSVFHDLEIQNCPFLDEIPLSQTASVPVPPLVPATPSVVPIAPPFIPYLPSGPVTLATLTSHRTHARAVRTGNPRPGVGAERPDSLAAKLWIRTAQCDWRTASKLSKKSTEESTLFPPQSCFLCFEATLKALTAVLYLYGGSCCDVLSDRNLSLLLREVARYTTETIAARLEELVIPLMNYDEPTRFPCMTPGIGFYTPREFYTIETARGAIKSVRQILQKLKEATRHNEPNLESLMIEEGESGFIEMSCLSINEMFNFPMDCDLGTQNLRTDSDEFFTVARSFFATLPQVKIISIEKIINRECWKDFKRNVELQVSKYGESCLMIKPLFHGTRFTHPKIIYEHRVGFSMEYSNGGMWGKGLYFAVNSSYSDGLAHSLGNGEFCMFLAQVFVGYSEVRKNNSSILGPTGRFHSIQGCTGGSQVHILYQNGLAYPSYLITYSR